MLLVPYIHFLFASLKLTKQFPPRFNQIPGRTKLLKYLNIFKNFNPAQSFSCSTSMFLFFLPCTKGDFFEQNQFLHCSNWLKYYIKVLTLKLSAALLYRSGDLKSYFLYKTPVYPPIEDIKSFGQIGWSVQTWEHWLYPDISN